MFDTEHKEVASYVVPEQISGYEYEVESCMKAIQEGKTGVSGNASCRDNKDYENHGRYP